jgi:hypothetical protein
MSKKISFGAKRPSTQLAGNVDDWVGGHKPTNSDPTKRLTIDVPLGLHKRIKSQCAMQNLVMADEIRALLERHFPNTSEPGGPS